MLTWPKAATRTLPVYISETANEWLNSPGTIINAQIPFFIRWNISLFQNCWLLSAEKKEREKSMNKWSERYAIVNHLDLIWCSGNWKICEWESLRCFYGEINDKFWIYFIVVDDDFWISPLPESAFLCSIIKNNHKSASSQAEPCEKSPVLLKLLFLLLAFNSIMAFHNLRVGER